MPRIKGPNGLVLTVSDDLAAALMKGTGYEIVEDEKPTEKKATAKKATSPSEK